MQAVRDLTGQRFGKLTALEYLGDGVWRCRCDCGAETQKRRKHLVGGQTKSCGCAHRERVREDLTGRVYGRVTVVRFVDTIKKHPTWQCICECGTVFQCTSGRLTSGNTKSCGCLKREVTGRLNLKHGCARVEKRTPEYTVWKGVVKRCFNPNDSNFANYGGRGITVCDRWMEPDGQGFLNFLYDMGKRPSLAHSIDRIDVDGDYEPGNCRWADSKQQARNRTDNRVLTLNEKSQTMVEWAEELGMSYMVLSMRIQRGWSHERALTTPVISPVNN